MRLNLLRRILPPALLLIAGAALAEAYIPKSDAQVLERLPFRPADPVARELNEMRAALRKSPQDRELAVRLADRYYDLVGEDGDPRYLGYAQAALAPWWTQPAPPSDVRLVRARLRQFLHDFPGAMRDLDAILAADPAKDSARILRAFIRIVQADYAPARADCEAMRGGPNALAGAGCESMIDGLTGHAAAGEEKLIGMMRARQPANAEEHLWLLVRLGELAQRRGQFATAEKYYRDALALGIPDTFLEAAHADLLLDLGRAAEVAALLKDKQRSDGLLLRLALAAQAAALPEAAQYQAALGARFTAAQMRGDTVHQQEEARFALHIQKNPAKALRLAQENWKVQREPRDARIYLEAAIAARDARAAAPVLQWLAASGIEDPLLRKLGAQLAGGGQ